MPERKVPEPDKLDYAVSAGKLLGSLTGVFQGSSTGAADLLVFWAFVWTLV